MLSGPESAKDRGFKSTKRCPQVVCSNKSFGCTALCRHETDHSIAFSVACYESPLNRAGVGSSAKVGQHCAGLASHCHTGTNTEYVQPSTNIHLQGQSKMYFLVKSREAHTDCFAAHMLMNCWQESLSHASLCRGRATPDTVTMHSKTATTLVTAMQP